VNRRELLLGAASVALMLTARAVVPPLRSQAADASEAKIGGRRLRGTDTGQILESLDDGKSWQTVMRLDPRCAVRGFTEHQAQVYARVVVRDQTFFLRSPDARTWHTVDAV
jgi:hypothetical protein